MAKSMPSKVYKAFDKREYMEAFLNGQLRLRTVKEFTRIDDARRRDPAEGEGAYEIAGPSAVYGHVAPDEGTHCFSMSNVTYVYCTSLESVDLDYLSEKFGPYIVEIASPAELRREIESFFDHDEYGPVRRFSGGRVDYSKGEPRAERLARNEESRLSYLQKPRSFSPELEYRFAVVCSYRHKAKEYVDVKFLSQPAYVKIVRDGN